MKKIILLLLFTQLLQPAHSIPKATKTLISAVKVQLQIRKKNPIQTFSDNKNPIQKFSGNHDFIQFAQTFELPEHYKQLIAEYRRNPDHDAMFMKLVRNPKPFTLNNLPNLYFKTHQWERIINAQRLKRCIEKYNLHLIAVPEKYVYSNNNVSLVCCEAVLRPGNDFKLTLEHVQQLKIVIEQTGACDLKWENCMFNSQGQLVIIDTEDRSFYSNTKVKSAFRRLQSKMTPEALSLVNSIPDNLYAQMSLSKSSLYDDPSWNFNVHAVKTLSKKKYQE